MLALGFLLVLAMNAFVLRLAGDVLDSFTVDSFWWALLAALIVAAVTMVLEVVFSTNDDQTYSLRVIQRVARRQGARPPRMCPASSSRDRRRLRSSGARCATATRRTWRAG